MPISKAAYLTVAAFVVKRSFSEAFQLTDVAQSPVSGGASYRASLICQPVVFRSSPNNPFSNRTSRSATMIHSADPWVTVSGLPVEERRILHKPNVMTSIFIPG
ncbi:hypothetical protein [Endozoicomonas sp. ALB091]|uniref:hypothetical protein n=1 Tax=Endozoicomonas sp. ALB091 TaxID=3403073 RepID=UPI003BB62AC7